MNNRDYKNSAPGGHYHIYNRGNARQNVFLDEDDYRFFLLRLRQNLRARGNEERHFRPLPPNSFTLISYCLMPNHFHLQIRQNSDLPTGVLIGKICTSYSMYFNKKYDRVGHIFQDRFKQASIEDDRYFLWLASYIHLNPVKAHLAKNATDYPWSSAGEYTQIKDDALCEKELILSRFPGNATKAYEDYLNYDFEADDKEMSGDLRIEDM